MKTNDAVSGYPGRRRAKDAVRLVVFPEAVHREAAPGGRRAERRRHRQPKSRAVLLVPHEQLQDARPRNRRRRAFPARHRARRRRARRRHAALRGGVDGVFHEKPGRARPERAASREHVRRAHRAR